MNYEVKIKHISAVTSDRRRLLVNAAGGITGEGAWEWLSQADLAAMGIDIDELTEADTAAPAGRYPFMALPDRLTPLLQWVRAGPVTLVYDSEAGPPPRLVALREAVLNLLAEEDRACAIDDPSSPTCYLNQTDLGGHCSD